MSAGSEPARATFWLLDAPDSLVRAEPPRARRHWPRLVRRRRQATRVEAGARGLQDRQFAREAREVSSSTFVAHVRFASTGALEPANTHPFEQHERLFAHNGVIEDLPMLEAHLGTTCAWSKATPTRAVVRADHTRDRRSRRRRRRRDRGRVRWVAAEPAAVSRSTSCWPTRAACGRSATRRRTRCTCSSASPASR